MVDGGKILLHVITVYLSDYCKQENILLEKQQCNVKSQRSMADMMFGARRLQELAGKVRYSLINVCTSSGTSSASPKHMTQSTEPPSRGLLYPDPAC